jgi:hypothetical protein
MEWISAGILAAQIIIAVVSYLTLHRHRVVYGLSTAVNRLPKGSRDDIYALQTEHIDDKLRSAKYTVLQIVERPADGDLEIILGQIRK